MHHSRSQPQLSRPDYAAEVPSEPEVSSVQFTAEDFPAASGSSMQPHGAMGLWAAFAGAGAGSSRSLMDAQFPALPALSRAQKKRVQEASKSLASRLSAAAQPPRVLNRAAAGAGPPGYTTAAAAAAVPPQVPQGSVPGASFQDVFPALSSVGGAGGMSGPCQWLGSGGASGSNANAGGSGSASGSGAAQPHRNYVDPGPSVLAASLLGFTTAGGSSSSASGAGPGQAAGAGSSSIASPSGPSRTQAALVAPLGGGRPPALGVQDFPSLAGTGGPSFGSGMTRPAPASAAMSGRTGSSSSLSALFSAGTSSSGINAISSSSSSSSNQRPASALGMGSGRAAVAASQMYQAAPKLETDDFPSLPVAPKGGKGKAKGKATAVVRAKHILCRGYLLWGVDMHCAGLLYI